MVVEHGKVDGHCHLMLGSDSDRKGYGHHHRCLPQKPQEAEIARLLCVVAGRNVPITVGPNYVAQPLQYLTHLSLNECLSHLDPNDVPQPALIPLDAALA